MDLQSQIRTAILSSSLPPPSQTLLTSLTTRDPPPPLPSLIATAKARLLSSDLTSTNLVDNSLQSFPLDIPNVTHASVRLPRDVHVQVVDIENLTSSRWEQIEELESIQRGERTRGREVIRVTDDGENNEPRTQTQRPSNAAADTAARNATHRLVLQDRLGKKVFALEMERLEKVGVGRTMMGEKILLRKGTTVARGTLLLKGENCLFLGGKVETWQRAWTEGRLGRLKETIGGDAPQ